MKSMGTKLMGIVLRLYNLIPRERRELIKLFFNLKRSEGIIEQVILGGEPFFFNIFRISKEDIQFLVKRIWEYDCYFLEGITNKSPVIFDIGAHIGVFSRFAFYKNTDTELWAFEPDKGNMQLLQINLINHYSKTKFIEKGVYFKKDKLKFYVSKKNRLAFITLHERRIHEHV